MPVNGRLLVRIPWSAQWCHCWTLELRPKLQLPQGLADPAIWTVCCTGWKDLLKTFVWCFSYIYLWQLSFHSGTWRNCHVIHSHSISPSVLSLFLQACRWGSVVKNHEKSSPSFLFSPRAGFPCQYPYSHPRVARANRVALTASWQGFHPLLSYKYFYPLRSKKNWAVLCRMMGLWQNCHLK